MIKYKARLVIQAINLIGGLIVVNLAYLTAYILRFKGLPPNENFGPYITVAPFITLATLVFFAIYGMNTNVGKSKSEVLSSVLCIVFLITISAIAISYFFGRFGFPRTVFLISALLQVPLVFIWFNSMKRFEQVVHGTKPVVAVGEYDECVNLSRRLDSNSFGLFKVRGIVTDNKANLAAEDAGIPIIGDYSMFKSKSNAFNGDLMIICSSIDPGQKQEIVYFCIENSIPLFIIPEIYEIMLAQSNIVQIGDTMLFGLDGLQINQNYRFIKRTMDIMIASVGLVLMALPLLLVALMIKVDSKGPVFYRQKRVGHNDQIFWIYKFRTMVQDAERESGPVLSDQSDSRITRVGRILRATRIDELPQLINVLLGEMSLVGPRPERPYFVNQFSQSIPEYMYRTHVKAGITGLAQVLGRYSTTPQDKLRYDLLYAKTYTPLNDVKILFQTLKVILMKDRSL